MSLIVKTFLLISPEACSPWLIKKWFLNRGMENAGIRPECA
jgi:hypothetical protein